MRLGGWLPLWPLTESSCHTPLTEFLPCCSLLLLPWEVLTLPGGTVELGAFLPTFPRAFTAFLGLVSLARVGSFFPASCWRSRVHRLWKRLCLEC